MVPLITILNGLLLYIEFLYTIINGLFFFTLSEYGNPGGMDAGGADFDSGKFWTVCVQYIVTHKTQHTRKNIIIKGINRYIARYIIRLIFFAYVS